MNELVRVNARSIARTDINTLWKNLKGEFILVFEDGEIKTNHRETIFSRYIWEFHLKYNQLPLLKRHFVQGVTDKRRYGVNTHLEVMNTVLWDTYDLYTTIVKDRLQLLDDLSLLVYEVSNLIYNELSDKLEPYTSSIDILDFIKITKNKEIENFIGNAPNTEKGVEDIYNFLNDKFKNDPDIKKNPLIKIVESGIAKRSQALQCLGVRGFVTDIDSTQFSKPVMRSFTKGIRSAHDAIIETRSAAKAIIFSENPLQQSEYFSRREQFIWQNVRNLHLGDCGSTDYLEWNIRDEEWHGEIKASDCDLKTLEGKFYLDDNTQMLKVLTKHDKHLIGKTIKLRSPIAGCKHPDLYGICEVCFGEASLAVPYNSNLGHIAGVSLAAVLGQSILSVKHLDASAKIEGIILQPHEKKYLSANLHSNVYNLSKALQGKEVKLIVKSYSDKFVNNAKGLVDIDIIDDIYKLSLSRVSEFKTINLSIKHNNSIEEVPLDINVGNRFPSFTYEAIEYIKKVGYQVDENNDYIIDMSAWDYKLPIFVLPLRHFNTSDHQKEIEVMLESRIEEMKKRATVVNPKSLIVDFHDLVNRRLTVPLSLLEIIIYSILGVDPMNNNYDLPKSGDKPGVGVLKNLIFKRSLGPAMAYENHLETLIDPENYLLRNRMDSIYDPIMMPELLNNP